MKWPAFTVLVVCAAACLDYGALSRGARDQSAAVELGVADLAGSDLAFEDFATDPGDLAGGVDSSGADLASASFDLATVDMAGPRHVFLLTARDGDLGSKATLDTLCQSAANTTALAGRPFVSVVQYAGVALTSAIQLGGRGTIVLPGGQTVSPDSAAGFWGNHVGPINQLASGAVNTSVCVWTGFTSAGAATGNPTCENWTDGISPTQGGAGSPTSTTAWATSGGTLGCSTNCHVYCIEQ